MGVCEYVKVSEEGRVKAEESVPMHFISERCVMQLYRINCVQFRLPLRHTCVPSAAPRLVHLKRHMRLIFGSQSQNAFSFLSVIAATKKSPNNSREDDIISHCVLFLRVTDIHVLIIVVTVFAFYKLSIDFIGLSCLQVRVQ